jgi:hypothetical protein
MTHVSFRRTCDFFLPLTAVSCTQLPPGHPLRFTILSSRLGGTYRLRRCSCKHVIDGTINQAHTVAGLTEATC